VPAVEIRHITKRFGSILANDDVSLSVRQGEVHALVGENGAGKSTLMNILYGMESPDSGEILVDGRHVFVTSPAAAIVLGIGMVHQHFMLVPALTVAENVVLGREPVRRKIFLDRDGAAHSVAALALRFQLGVDPGATVAALSVGMQQRVEILKLLYRDARILILDEPTAVLAPPEIDALFGTLRSLKDQGKTVILITHRLSEVMSVSDRITVLRHGRVVGDVETAKTDRMALARMMVGKDLELRTHSPSAVRGEPVLTVRNATVNTPRGLPLLHDVSFELFSGEILGFAAVEGNGQSELVDLVCGLRLPDSGSADLQGNPAGARVAHIPEDRIKRGMVGEFSLAENLVLGRLHDRRFARWGVMNLDAIGGLAAGVVRSFDIRPPEPGRALRKFSGGNQQKAVVARELGKESPLIIANHPTRGLDIAAADFVHGALLGQRERGRGILLFSSDLGEILRLSDRIAVLFRGRLVAMMDAGRTTEQELGAYMTGAALKAAS